MTTAEMQGQPMTAAAAGVTGAGRLTALIVDDEPLARRHLRGLLEEQGVEVVGEAEQAAAAIQLAEDLQPDLLLLDIQMPGLTGLQLAEALQQGSARSLVIFVTGYSEFAAAAFEQAVLDYVVKPASATRIAKTLARARERIAAARAAGSPGRAPGHWVAETPEPPPAAERLRRLPIRKDYSVRLVRVEEILSAVAREKRVFVRTEDGEEHRTYYTLTQLERLLPADLFLRVHDSCIVRLTAVEEILFLGNHSYAVRLAGGEQLPVGRSRYAGLQERLGIASAGP
jgi:DNA-binding LytR/AlgR family response regulator